MLLVILMEPSVSSKLNVIGSKEVPKINFQFNFSKLENKYPKVFGKINYVELLLAQDSTFTTYHYFYFADTVGSMWIGVSRKHRCVFDNSWIFLCVC